MLFYDNKKHKLPHIHASFGDDDAIFSIEEGEIIEGTLPRNKRKLVEAYLQDVVWLNVDILPYDERAAGWHAEQRARLVAKGQTPSFVDGQIAAIAKVNGLVLVTRDIGDFSRFEDLEVTNWHQDIRED